MYDGKLVCRAGRSIDWPSLSADTPRRAEAREKAKAQERSRRKLPLDVGSTGAAHRPSHPVRLSGKTPHGGERERQQQKRTLCEVARKLAIDRDAPSTRSLSSSRLICRLASAQASLRPVTCDLASNARFSLDSARFPWRRAIVRLVRPTHPARLKRQAYKRRKRFCAST